MYSYGRLNSNALLPPWARGDLNGHMSINEIEALSFLVLWDPHSKRGMLSLIDIHLFWMLQITLACI